MAVVSDLMRVAREIRSGSPERVSPFAHERLGEYKPVSITLQKRPYYLRFRVEDRPGIIAELAGILAAKQISLEAVLQEPCDTKHDLPFVITVEPTSEQAIRDAVAQMSQLTFCANRRWRCRWNRRYNAHALLFRRGCWLRLTAFHHYGAIRERD